MCFTHSVRAYERCRSSVLYWLSKNKHRNLTGLIFITLDGQMYELSGQRRIFLNATRE